MCNWKEETMADAPRPRSFPAVPAGRTALRLRDLPLARRLTELQRLGLLPMDEVGFIASTPPKLAELFDELIENAIGAFPVPLGVATNFVVNGRPHLVAMANEERSVVAAASKGAKRALPDGFTVTAEPPRTRAQIMYAGLPDPPAVLRKFRERRAVIEDLLRSECNPMAKRGGELTVLEPRFVPGYDRDTQIIVELEIGTAEAMGANVVTRIAEAAADKLLRLFAGTRPTAVICSNESAGWRVAASASFWIGSASGVRRIMDMQTWAEHDASRAVTHNKGVMNAVSAACLATGQDTRAVEACAHAYAARTVGYKPLTAYAPDGDRVRGTLELMLPIGTVGGATGTPSATLCRALMGAATAKNLACIIAAAGLAQNFAALLALVGEGIPGSHARLSRQRR